MNIERMLAAIELMIMVGEQYPEKFDLDAWFRSFGMLPTKRLLINTCGTTACFAGWLALSPEWKRAGGRITRETKVPEFNGNYGYDAASVFLEIPYIDAQFLCMPYHAKACYGKNVKAVTAFDVAEKLIEMVKAEIA